MLQWSTALPDWQRRIVARESLIPCAPLFADEARASIEVFDALRLVDVVGSPTFGEIARPWIRDFVSVLFGAYDAESGRRLITEYMLLVAKKNSKSTLAAGIMLTALVRNWRQSGEFTIIAPTVEIANNSFGPAQDMVYANEDLTKLLHVQPHFRTITHRLTDATLKIVAADSETVGGKKSIGVLIDELWLFGKRASAENMLREATGGLAARPEGFIIYLSTQSDEAPAGVFAQRLIYARGVRDGRIDDPKFLPLLYEFPDSMIEADEHLQPNNFYVPNPNLGASVDEEYLLREHRKAEEAGYESMRGFLAKHLNVQIEMALHAQNWPGAQFWPRCGRRLTLKDLLARSEVVTIGIDGGGLDDMLGLVVLGRTSDDRWLLWAHAWLHPVALERRKMNLSKYQDFAADGDLTIVQAMGEDVREVGDIIEQVEKSELLDRIGVDQAGIAEIVDEAVARKIERERILGIPQGWRMHGAIKTLERRLAEGTIEHSGSRLMAWVISNARAEARGNATIITKQAAGFAKIDPLMAAFDAVALMTTNPQPRKKLFQVFVVG